MSHIALIKDTYGTVDLTPSYHKLGGPDPPPQPPTSILRGFAFTPSFEMLYIVDEIQFPSARNVTWGMHIKGATYTAGDDTASGIIEQNGVKLYARVLSPSKSTPLKWVAPYATPPQDSLAGVNKLVVQVQEGETRIIVALSPNPLPSTVALPNPVSTWATTGPF